jgi:hypothetical protein
LLLLSLLLPRSELVTRNRSGSAASAVRTTGYHEKSEKRDFILQGRFFLAQTLHHRYWDNFTDLAWYKLKTKFGNFFARTIVYSSLCLLNQEMKNDSRTGENIPDVAGPVVEIALNVIC